MVDSQIKPDIDERTVRRAQKGDLAALSLLVDTYSDRLFTLLKRLLRNEHDAEDALQETFVTMMDKLPTFRHRSSVSTWLYRIATNTALMHLRKQHPQRRLSLDEESILREVHEGHHASLPKQPDTVVLSGETKDILDEAVEHLPPAYRAVFVLRDIEQRTVRETARILKISESNVKTRLRRARIFLREHLGDSLS